jgi:hypothetical protein
MEISLRELLVAKGVFTADEIRKQVEDMDNRGPAQGARLVAKAWVDPEYRSLLLSDGGEACVVAGLDRGPYKLVVVENTHDTHNVIVCTLCSCYPRWLLGLPPDWYKSRAYRSRMVREPRVVLREFGTEIPDDVYGTRARFDRRHALSRVAAKARRNGRMGRGTSCPVGYARLDDRRQLAAKALRSQPEAWRPVPTQASMARRYLSLTRRAGQPVTMHPGGERDTIA